MARKVTAVLAEVASGVSLAPRPDVDSPPSLSPRHHWIAGASSRRGLSIDSSVPRGPTTRSLSTTSYLTASQENGRLGVRRRSLSSRTACPCLGR
jgi:hypothetical protein